jgi:hypothetical protein
LELGEEVSAAVMDSMVEEIFARGLTKFAAAKPSEGDQLKEVFDKMELDPETTSLTLGTPHHKMTTDTLLRASNKLLNISRGMEKVDDRDSLAFQNFHGPEDFFAERIRKDAGQTGRKLLWKATLRGHLKHVPSGVLTPQLNSVLIRSGMGQPLEEINPAEVYDQQHRVLRLGEGGIPSHEAVPDESRNVQPSHFGYIDPVRAPECYAEDMEVMTYSGWKKWPEVTLQDRFSCLINGQLEFHTPNRLIDEPYNGLMFEAETEFLSYSVTPQHRMYVRPQSHGAKKGSSSTHRQTAYAPIYRFEEPEAVAHSVRLFLCGGHAPHGGSRKTFALPVIVARGVEKQIQGNPPIGNRLKLFGPIDINDWAAFMGWYLAEGSLNDDTTRISQCEKANPLNCLAISQLLDRLPFTWSFQSGDEFNVSSRQLSEYLRQFGFSNEKFIPPEIFEAPVVARQLFVDAIMNGDGRRDRHGVRRMLCTCSHRLALDFQRLAFQLGYSTRLAFEPDVRKSTYFGCWIVYLHRTNERLVTNKSPRHPQGQYKTTQYSGRVYCATVPGGLLYVRRGNSLGFWCGNSEAMGVDSRVAHSAVKGSDGKIYTPMLNMRTNKTELVAADRAARRVVAFPGESPKNGYVRAMVNARQVEYVPIGKVDYVLPHTSAMFNTHSNLIPMINAANAGRLLMGSKMLNQALALKNAEAPLVQTAHPEGGSFEDWLGKKMGTAHSDVEGMVTKVDKDGITIKDATGQEHKKELYDHFIFNRKTYLHNTPVVEVGTRVGKGQLLAKSNYTDKNGTAAIGTNLRVGFMPFRGLNYEDAIVISAGAAKRLSSEHAYQHPLENPSEMEVGRKQFISIYPGKFKPQQLQSITENGTVKPGTVVHKGDPLILALHKSTVDAVHKGHKSMFTDGATLWDHDADGIVTDVVKTKDGGFNVVVKAYAPMQEGDKMAGRYGNKGVVGKIVPDSQMPHDANGQPMEVLLNPLGVISRGNPAQMFESLLGKVARKRGEPYKLEAFNKENWIDFVTREAKKHGVNLTEDLQDPQSGRRVPGILTGEMFMMKLHHTSESKGSGRDVGGYTCYDDETEVLTKRGWLNWTAVKFNDLFFTEFGDGSTGYVEAENLIKEKFDGELFAFAGRYVDYAVTANHRMYVEFEKRNKPFDFHTADKVHGHRFYVKQSGFKPEAGDSSGQFELEAAPQPIVRKQTGSEYEVRSIDAGDYAELLGWWLSEGHVVVNEAESDYKVHISQSQTVKPLFFAQIEALLNRLPFNWFYFKRDGKKCGVVISSKQLALHLRPFGTSCENKFIPRHLLDACPAVRRRLYEAMMSGDGSRTETSTTVSTRLADDFQELCVRLGLGAVVRPCGERKEKHYLQAWHVGISLKRTTALVSNRNAVPGFYRKKYSGYVYCATVPTGKLYVRRNGKPMLCGNSEEQPAKGGPEGAKRISNMEMNALLSHGATNIIRDAHLVRGQRNDDYWKLFRMGMTPPSPREPFVYKKFLSFLAGSGINLKKKGDRLQLFAMTDKDVDGMSGGAIQSADTVTGDKFEPVPGGFFDESLTGGHHGSKWSHIQLHEPTPNPVMEEPIRRLLGLTQKGFEKVLSGEEKLNGESGGAGIKKLLAHVNIDDEIRRNEALIESGSVSKRDAAAKLLGYLKAMKENGTRPEDWVMSKVPVLPPSMRPITAFNGMQLTADPNYLYRDLFLGNEDLKNVRDAAGHEAAGEERLRLYHSLKAVTGLGDPVQPKTQDRGVRGLLQHIFGSSPKMGMFQRRVLGTAADIVGRATITPNPDLNMDQVGLPEDRAWTIYRPFIVRRLVRKGMPATAAVRTVVDRGSAAREALEAELKERPVLINRAPTLYKYGFMAAWPVLTKGHTLQLSPVVTPGFTADFDGDAMNYHVPVTDDAVKDAVEKMMPSKNLKSVKDFKVHYLPNQEFVMGLYLASHAKNDKVPTRVFASREAAVAAYKRGEIGASDRVTVKD